MPDHSTLSVFRGRLVAKEGLKALEGLFQRVVRIAKEEGIVFGRIQVVDATQSVADVDVEKERERRDGGKGPRDKDAAWGSKVRQRVKTVEGETATTSRVFYGHKAHLSLNAESVIITPVVVTPGNGADGKKLARLVEKDEAVGVKAEIYAGDKAYGDGENHGPLRAKGKKSALCLNRYRTEKKDRNKGLCVAMVGSEAYREGQRERYKIEQKNAEAKRRHGLGRCRYLGLVKYGVQSLLTAMVLNLKRMVRLLAGVGFRRLAARAAWGVTAPQRGAGVSKEVKEGRKRGQPRSKPRLKWWLTRHRPRKPPNWGRGTHCSRIIQQSL